MTPREQLKFLEDHHASFDIKEFDEVAAALRELDQLLDDLQHLIENSWYEPYMNPILERLKKAGYSQK